MVGHAVLYGSEQDFWKRVRDEPYFGAEISEAMGRELSLKAMPIPPAYHLPGLVKT